MLPSLFRYEKVILCICIVFSGLGISLAGISYVYQETGVTTEDITFFPSDPTNFLIEDTAFQLHGRFYYPRGFDSSQRYATILLFHGVTRSIADLDPIARTMADFGAFCFAIDFRGHGSSGGTFDFDDWNTYNLTFGDAAGAYRVVSELSYANLSNICSYGQSLGGGSGLFLALSDLTPKFCVWYPATAYNISTLPIYNHTSSNPDFLGYIIQGTADGCGRCAPTYTQYFVDENAPNIEVYWLEGGIHGATSETWSLYMSLKPSFGLILSGLL
jgi:hypothetical protein